MPNSPVRVLCVEDDPDMMFLVRMILGEPEWALSEAADAPEGLDVAKAEPPDIALLDYMLPGMDGIKLAEALRTMFPAMPIVLFSAHPMIAAEADTNPAIDAFVSKGDVMKVDQALRDLLAR